MLVLDRNVYSAITRSEYGTSRNSSSTLHSTLDSARSLVFSTLDASLECVRQTINFERSVSLVVSQRISVLRTGSGGSTVRLLRTSVNIVHIRQHTARTLKRSSINEVETDGLSSHLQSQRQKCGKLVARTVNTRISKVSAGQSGLVCRNNITNTESVVLSVVRLISATKCAISVGTVGEGVLIQLHHIVSQLSHPFYTFSRNVAAQLLDSGSPRLGQRLSVTLLSCKVNCVILNFHINFE